MNLSSWKNDLKSTYDKLLEDIELAEMAWQEAQGYKPLAEEMRRALVAAGLEVPDLPWTGPPPPPPRVVVSAAGSGSAVAVTAPRIEPLPAASFRAPARLTDEEWRRRFDEPLIAMVVSEVKYPDIAKALGLTLRQVISRIRTHQLAGVLPHRQSAEHRQAMARRRAETRAEKTARNGHEPTAVIPVPGQPPGWDEPTITPADLVPELDPAIVETEEDKTNGRKLDHVIQELAKEGKTLPEIILALRHRAPAESIYRRASILHNRGHLRLQKGVR